MNNGLGYQLANVPTITGLSSVNADIITSSVTSTDTLLIDGVDVSGEINNQKARIIALELKTTGITYDDTGGADLTTIDNNVTITSGKVLTVNGIDIGNTLTGISYSNVGAVDLTTIDNNVSITKNVSGAKFSVSASGAFIDPVAGDNAGYISQNIFSNATIIQNQATNGLIQLNTRNASNVLATRFSISSSDLTITTTNNPTMSGYTDPASSDNTSKVATTRWVQTAVSNYFPTKVNINATIPPDIYYIPVVSGTGDQKLRTDLLLNYEIITGGTIGEITANLNGNAGTSNQILVNNDNTATTYALTFCVGGAAGYKSLFIDPTTTALNYQPNTGTLSGTIFNGSSMSIRDTAGGIQLATHSYNTNTYAIENSSSTGIINFITNAATQFSIDPTKCSFTNPPECSVAPTTANMLCNKNYIDTNTLTLTGTQTISGQKTFTNVSNSYAGSGASLTGVVHTTGAESISGDKTFINGIIMSDAGSNTSTMAQYNNQFNFISNVLNNTTTTITGLIPSVNLSCIVRTDSATPVGNFGFITAGTNINRTYFNNFYNGTTSITTPGITITALTIIQSTSALALGACIISFIGTRFALGTYIIADLGSGNYTISQNALVASAVKATTSVSYTPLSRAYLAGGAAAGSITFDFNNTLNLNCLNQSSVALNAIQIKASLNTSTVNMFGDLSCKGQLNFNIGTLITASITLAVPLAQHYPVAMGAAAQTITLPAPTDATVLGASITFKRRTNTTAFTLAAGAGTPILPNSSITQAATFAFGVGVFQGTFVCDGVNWCCISIS